MKITVLGAGWCPVTTETRRLWRELKEKYDFQYEYVEIDTEKGKRMAKDHAVNSVPKTFVGDRMMFDGVPDRAKAIEMVKIASEE